jgi:tRNA-dihydrouridine synthase
MNTSINIWNKLKDKPLVALAPMDDVTDVVFRRLVHELAPADVYFTEFASVEGFCSPGRVAIEQRLRTHSSEGPVVAQIWGTTPKYFYEMARELSGRDFVGIDINMGCPVRDIIKNGACSALIKNPELAGEIIAATKQGAGNLPVSVKTRLGWSQPDISEWLGFLMRQNIDALTIHMRTVREKSKVDAHWELASEIISMRDDVSPGLVLLGNGDVANRLEAEAVCDKTGIDGAMIGRGIFQNPWAFETKTREHNLTERFSALNRHLDIFEDTWDEDEKRFEPLKRFFKIYIHGFEGAAGLRAQLMECHNIQEVRELISAQSTS